MSDKHGRIAQRSLRHKKVSYDFHMRNTQPTINAILYPNQCKFQCPPTKSRSFYSIKHVGFAATRSLNDIIPGPAKGCVKKLLKHLKPHQTGTKGIEKQEKSKKNLKNHQEKHPHSPWDGLQKTKSSAQNPPPRASHRRSAERVVFNASCTCS